VRWSGTGSGPAGPWRLIERLPVVQEIVANRLSMAMFLALGVLVATAGNASVIQADVFEARRERSLRFLCWCIPILLVPGPARPPRTVSSAAESTLNRVCAGALAVTMPQRLEQEAMAWQARTDFAFNLYRGFAFRSSTLPKGDRLLLDDIAEQGAGATVDAADALAELRSHGITCVLSPATAQDTIADLEPTLGTPTVAGDVVVWPNP
jgi:hypothetical protein